MTIEFKLPDLGEGVASADVANILIGEGDTISPEQNVLELETEKAVVELPSPHAGKVVELRVKAGQTVKPGDVLMLLDAAEAGDSQPEKKAPPQSSASPAKSESRAKPETQPKQGATATTTRTAQGTASGTLEFKLPDLGEGVTQADIANVLIQEGDDVTAGQNVLELETEKAVVELPVPQDGKIEKLHVQAGQTVKVGDLLMTIAGTTAKSPEATADTQKESPAAKKTLQTSSAAPRESTPIPPSSPFSPDSQQPATAPQAAVEETTRNGAPAPAGPATRRLARELGVDLHRVTGTGRGGRITPEDVQAYVRQLTSGKVAATGTSAGIELPPLPDFTQFGEIERKPMNKIAKTAANNLSIAWQTIPHVTQHELADVTELEAGRKRHSQNKGAAKITMTVLAIKAVVAALKQFPQFNASLDTTTNEVIHKHYYHIGVAVDTEQGLVVPVIRNVNQKSILDIARELDSLAGKARDRKLSPSDFQGGTFTITNLGGIGGTMFTPIVNYPEVAILGMSRAKPQYVIVDGAPEIRLMLPLSLSYDHRVINGADAARFIVKVAGLLADPSQLLIES